MSNMHLAVLGKMPIINKYFDFFSLNTMFSDIFTDLCDSFNQHFISN